MTLPAPPEGLIDGPVHRFAVRAWYEDTDLSGAVYHANYLKWFERARSDLVRLLGIDQRAAQESGEGTYAVSELAIRYLAPARLDDAVAIETLATEVGAASCRLVQRAWRGDTLLAEARVRVGFIGPDGRPRRQPAAWRAAFHRIVQTETP
ncbi:YbgC/FadM family acyl-CoA thioesterase [Novosphingobium bradum]|uniref:YbgC/FadM family acyl-CoA thioesterase n=1 Tax=Novosphingobium bradum TaxID=1737444 RepID=A0ABV7ITK9_9SPHN